MKDETKNVEINNTSHEILQTERLLLRHLQVSDMDSLVDLWTDPIVMRFMGGPREVVKLRVSIESALNDNKKKYDLWTIVEKKSGQVIGECGLIEKEVEGKSEIELVYILAKNAWGKGYATEIADATKKHAFRVLGLERIISLIDPENEASEKVAQKVGMHLEKVVIRPNGNKRRVYVVETKGI